MRLEESHDGCHEVPGEVDGGKEADGLDRCLVGEQHSKGMQQPCVLTLCLDRLTAGFPVAALFELALHVPRDERHDEEGQEHHPRTEHIQCLFSQSCTTDEKSQCLHPTEQVAVGGKEHAQ